MIATFHAAMDAARVQAANTGHDHAVISHLHGFSAIDLVVRVGHRNARWVQFSVVEEAVCAIVTPDPDLALMLADAPINPAAYTATTAALLNAGPQ